MTYIHTFTCACMLYMLFFSAMHTHIYMCMYVVHAFFSAIHTHIYICMYVVDAFFFILHAKADLFWDVRGGYSYIHIYVCSYICTYAHTYTHSQYTSNISIYTHILAHFCTHIHMHTRPNRPGFECARRGFLRCCKLISNAGAFREVVTPVALQTLTMETVTGDKLLPYLCELSFCVPFREFHVCMYLYRCIRRTESFLTIRIIWPYMYICVCIRDRVQAFTCT
jgi:hypothetical protein